MYRIKNDKRVFRSAGLISDGLQKCLRDKPFEQISVSDICKAAGVSRATFYRLFDIPSDILEYACETFAQDIVLDYKTNPPKNRREGIRFILEHWISKTDLVESVFKSHNSELLWRAMEKHWSKDLSLSSNGYTEDERDYIKAVSAAQICSVLFVWMKHGKKESVDSLINLFYRIRH